MTIQPVLTPGDLIREGVSYLRPEDARYGTLAFGTDEDYFLFHAEPNRQYTVRVDSGIDTMLGAYDLPGLALFAADDDSGPGATPALSFITQDAPLLVLFQVDASFAGEPDEFGTQAVLGSYEIVVEDDRPTAGQPPFGVDVIGDTFATAAGIMIETEVAGDIDFAGDIDVYATWLEAGREYLIRAASVGQLDPFVELFDEDGRIIEVDGGAPGDPDAEILYAAPVSGIYYVGVSGSDLLSDLGGYDLLVDDRGAEPLFGGPDLVGDTITFAEPVEVGLLLPGAIDDFADLDVYELRLEAGARYRFEVFGFDGLDPDFYLLDPAGRAIAYNDDGGAGFDARLDFLALVDGNYYLEVGSSFSDAGPFDLSVELRRPGEALTGDAMDVALMYEAGLGRVAQFGGLNFWIDRFEATSLRDVSWAFLDSPEFIFRVGDIDFISDFELVDGLYRNVLGRPGAPAGVDFWLDRLASPGFDEADLLIAFARSPENLAGSPYVEDIEMVGPGTWDFV